ELHHFRFGAALHFYSVKSFAIFFFLVNISHSPATVVLTLKLFRNRSRKFCSGNCFLVAEFVLIILRGLILSFSACAGLILGVGVLCLHVDHGAAHQTECCHYFLHGCLFFWFNNNSFCVLLSLCYKDVPAF